MNDSENLTPAHPGGASDPGEVLAGRAPSWVQERGRHGLAERLQEVLRLGSEVRHTFARRLELGPNELAAMEHLAGEPIGPVELSRRLKITSAAATLLLHRLVEAGHVERRPHPTDRRRQVVVPTDSGLRGIFRELRPMVAALDATALELDEAARAVVADYLDRVAEVLRYTVEHGPQEMADEMADERVERPEPGPGTDPAERSIRSGSAGRRSRPGRATRPGRPAK